MNAPNSSKVMTLSRRGLFRGGGLVAGGAILLGTGLMAGPAAATQLDQKTAGYQDKPRGKLQCDNCKQWQPPAACKIVKGAIAPAGWCTLYAPAPKAA